MWANATIWRTDLGIMSLLDFVVGTVNRGWVRPLAKSRTSRNQGVLVLEKLSLETSVSKNRVLCQRAIRCTSTWRYRIRIFQSTRERGCKFPKHVLQNLFLRFAKSDFGICKIRKLTFANTWPHPGHIFENNRLQLLMSGFREITEKNNEGPCCNEN